MDITLEQLFEAVAQFNELLFPAQWAAMIIAIAAVVFVFIKKSFSNALIIGVAILFFLLSALAFWLPAGIQGYNNGYLYTALFLMQAVFLLSAGVEDELHFKFEAKAISIIGFLVVIYALIGYPLVGLAIGRSYPALIFSPLFPCPLNIWLMGMLLMTEKPVPRYTLILPFIWGLIGIMWTALGVTEDIAVILINLVGPAILVYRDRGKYHHLHYP